MSLDVSLFKDIIEKRLCMGQTKFVIFPFGNVGRNVKYILNNAYGVEEVGIIDSHFSKFNHSIQNLECLKEKNMQDVDVILAIDDEKKGKKLQDLLLSYGVDKNRILCLYETSKFRTKVGKYSYGPLCCNHEYIDKIGSFCSFAFGTDVVPNHQLNYVTTHPMLYHVSHLPYDAKYDDYKNEKWYFPGVSPKPEKKAHRITIGNDVWLGRNVIITNYSNIGNGVIAAAGAVITKDVPDYAVVAGVPAKIIRYRYTKDQIKALNEIAWWDWDDVTIRERYDDFYLPIDDFIYKYRNRE